MNKSGSLVILESINGELEPSSLALAGQAAAWAQNFDPLLSVEALVFGQLENAGDILGPYSVSRVYQCILDDVEYAPDTAARTAASLVLESGQAWVFCLSNSTVISAPLLAVLLEAGLVSKCLGLDRNHNGGFIAQQPLHDGRLDQEVILDPTTINILTWEPHVLGRWEPRDGKTADVSIINSVPSPYSDRLRTVMRIPGDFRTLPLDQADRIVAMGRGLIPNGMSLIRDAAEFLEASLGAARPVIDAGLMPFERQIGQTGVSVAPRLLLACGISGANEFTVGMTDSRTVAAINTDPRALIFSYADLGLVGDAAEVLQELLKLCRGKSEQAESAGAEESS